MKNITKKDTLEPGASSPSKPESATTTLKKGRELELEIESLAFGGRGVARVDGFVVFVDDALPGQKVSARITRKRKGFAEARVQRTLRKSTEEVVARCSHFGECGGCRSQNLAYEAQLKYKQLQVVESLVHLGGFSETKVLSILPSPVQFHYRNKMEFSFGRNRWLTSAEIRDDVIVKPRDFALGLHVRGRHDRILDLDECYLGPPLMMEVVRATREFAFGSGLPVYSTQDHVGFWRHLVVRVGQRTRETLVNIVTSDMPEGAEVVERLSEQLISRFDITTIVQNINRRKAQVAVGDEERVLHGRGVIHEEIGECRYRISANSFFQTNSLASEILYEQVRNFADLGGNEVVYDLYAGAGSIAIYLARHSMKVLGFEIVPEAISDGFANCNLNGVTNCEFIQGDLRETISCAMAQTRRPDVVIIDPPRAGMHNDVVKQLVTLKPDKIIYVSCNPSTFARDARLLCDSGYDLRQTQPVDMFPMTPHIELVSKLTLTEF